MEAGNGTAVADDARSAGRSELAGQLLHLSVHRAGTAATFLRKSLYSHDNRRAAQETGLERPRPYRGKAHPTATAARRSGRPVFPHHTKPNRMSLKLQSFGPIADKHSRVLVLGTMRARCRSQKDSITVTRATHSGRSWHGCATGNCPKTTRCGKPCCSTRHRAVGRLRRVRAGRKPRQQHLPREAEPHRRTAAQLSLDPRDRFQRTGRRTTVQETLRPARLGIRSADPAFDQPRPCRRVDKETGRMDAIARPARAGGRSLPP